MDVATVGGLVLAWVSLIVAILLEGAKLTQFIKLSAFIIIIGGTFGATIISFSTKQFKDIFKIMSIAFRTKEINAASIIKTLVSFAERARREGLLVLEEDAAKVDDAFLRKGVQLVVDGTDMDLVRNILETELSFLAQRHKVGEDMFMTLGGFSPTLGIIGTVMGLVFALSHGVEDASETAKAIAVAFLATLYGISFANLIFIPIANKLKMKSREEILLREVMIEGILSIQAGDNPRIVEEKLKAFLPPILREQVQAGGRRSAGAPVGEGVRAEA